MDGPGEIARFNWEPYESAGFGIDPARGYLYIADNKNGLLRRVRTSDGYVTTLAPDLQSVLAVAVDQNGVVYADNRYGLADKVGLWRLTPQGTPGQETYLVERVSTNAYGGYLVADANRQKVYGAKRGSDIGTLVVWDLSGGNFPVPREPIAVPDGSRTNEWNSDGPLEGARFWCPCGLSISPDGRYLYFGGGDEWTYRRIDVDERRVASLYIDEGYDAYGSRTGPDIRYTWRERSENQLVFEWPLASLETADGTFYVGRAARGLFRLTPDRAVKPPAPVALWLFEEASGTRVHDSAGGHDGTIVGSAPSRTAGKFGGALDLNHPGGGGSDYVEVPDFAYNTGTGISLSYWFKVDGAENGNTDSIYAHLYHGGHASGVDMYQRGNGDGTLEEYNVGSGGTSFGNDALDDGQWHHVVAVFTQGMQTIYVDGIPAMEGVASLVGSDPAGPLYFGNRGGQYGFPGSLDDIAIWDCALTSNNVAWIWQDGTGNSVAGTLDNIPPIVSITSPSVGARYRVPGQITIRVNAYDLDGTITNVRFYANGTMIGEDAAAPYRYTWTNVPAGSYALSAEAFDDAGAAVETLPVDIWVVASGGSEPQTPLALWTFDDGGGARVADAIGDNHGTIMGSSPAWTAGKFGSGLDLNHPGGGGSDYVEVPDFDYGGGPGISMSYWFKVLGAENGNTDYFYGHLYHGGNATGIEMYQYGNGNGKLKEFNIGSSGADYGTSSLDDGNWHHVVAVFSPGVGQTLYVDGSPALSNGGGSALDGPSGPLWFGRRGTTYGFPGSFDEIAIWDCVLSTNEIAWLWNDGAGNSLLQDPPNSPPNVSVTTPADGASFTAPASITLEASASDSDGTVAKVEFFEGTNKLGEDFTSPYSYTWSGVAAGTYSLTAVAMDDDGAATTSAAVGVTVQESGVSEPGTPVALWAFDDGSGTTVADAVGANDGTIVGTEPAWVMGKFAYALDLNDTGSAGNYVSVPDFYYGGGGITVAYWFKVTAGENGNNGAWYGHLYHGGGGTGIGNGIEIYQRGPGSTPTGDRGKLREYNKGSSGNDFGSNTLADGNWHHVAAVFTPGVGQTIYVDGSVALSNSGGSAIDNPSGNIWFGRRGGTNTGFPGSFDEIAIWTNALSANEVTWLWNEGTGNSLAGGVSNDGLVCLFTFSETNGTVAADSSPYGNDNSGTLMGTASFVDGTVVLNGGSDYIALADSSDISMGIHSQRTVTVRFQVDDKTITSRRQVVYEEGGSTKGLSIYVYGGLLYVGGWNLVDVGWSGAWLSTDAIQNGAWHSVILTLNGTDTVQPGALKGYLDGTPFGSGEGSRLWEHSDGIGTGGIHGQSRFHDGVTGGGGLAGAIDELRIYNRELSAPEAEALSP